MSRRRKNAPSAQSPKHESSPYEWVMSHKNESRLILMRHVTQAETCTLCATAAGGTLRVGWYVASDFAAQMSPTSRQKIPTSRQMSPLASNVTLQTSQMSFNSPQMSPDALHMSPTSRQMSPQIHQRSDDGDAHLDIQYRDVNTSQMSSASRQISPETTPRMRDDADAHLGTDGSFVCDLTSLDAHFSSHCSFICYSTHLDATHYNTQERTATHCNTLQYSAILCNTL